jgi:uncharacterized membrane protein
MDQENQTTQGDEHAQMHAPTPVVTETANTASNTADDHKLFAIVGYILPILFFVPMVIESSKNNAFARFHANQQLSLLIVWLVVQVALGQLLYMVLGGGMYMLMPIINLGLLVLVVLGIINAAQGEMKKLPLIGGFSFLDKLFKK